MQEKVTYWRLPQFDNLELLQATYYTHKFKRHIHEEYSISVIEGGGNTFYHRGDTHLAPSGRVIVINPQEIHTGTPADHIAGLNYSAVYPGVVLMRQIASELSGIAWQLPFFKQSVIYDPFVADLLRRFHRLMRDGEIIAQETALRVALGALIARHAENRPHMQQLGDESCAVSRAREYIDHHYDRAITLDTLAEVTALSPFYLARVFHRDVGLPPHKYLMHVRVCRAKAFLTTGIRAGDVAQITGFTDQSHLTRAFKQVVGITPGHYARLSC